MVRCLLLLLLAGFTACNSEKTFILNPEALPTQTFRINTAADTVIKTAGGVLLEIPAGSLSGGASADLEVQEALAFTDMLKAGLTTQTADGILRSGGMISVNAADKNISIAKPITVSVPTKEFDPKMQVFKGEQKDGKIEWANPRPLQDTLPVYLARGKALFEGNCDNCHAMDKMFTGPALHGVEYRGPWNDRKALYDYVRNPGEFSAASPYAECLLHQYGQLMTAFPQLSDEQLAAVFDYIRYDEIKNGLAFYRDPCQDSCSRYDSAMRALHTLQLKREKSIVDNGPLSSVDYGVSSAGGMAGGDDTAEEDTNLVDKRESKAAYYKFEIDAFGWYNADAVLKDEPPLKESVLTVTLEGKMRTDVDIYLAIPSLKVFTLAGRTNNPDEFAFITKDGKLYTPQGEQAYIFAMGENADGILFGYKPFTITSKQNIPISVQPSTKEEVYKLFNALNFDGVSVKVEETKNATEIRQLDKQIAERQTIAERLKPKGCDCGCPAAVDSLPAGIAPNTGGASQNFR